MRIVASIVLIGIGLVWIGQGAGLIPGSFMTGDPFWAAMGGIALIAGLLIAWHAFRRSKRPQGPRL